MKPKSHFDCDAPGTGAERLPEFGQQLPEQKANSSRSDFVPGLGHDSRNLVGM